MLVGGAKVANTARSSRSIEENDAIVDVVGEGGNRSSYCRLARVDSVASGFNVSIGLPQQDDCISTICSTTALILASLYINVIL